MYRIFYYMKNLKFILIIGILLFTGTSVKANFIENFESYELGEFYYNGQPNWQTEYLNDWIITDEKSKSGTKSLRAIQQQYNVRLDSKIISTQAKENLNYHEFITFDYFQEQYYAQQTTTGATTEVGIIARSQNNTYVKQICPRLTLRRNDLTTPSSASARLDTNSAYHQEFNNQIWNKFGIDVNIYNDDENQEVVCEVYYVINVGFSSPTKTTRTSYNDLNLWNEINLKLQLEQEGAIYIPNNKYYFDNIQVGNPNSYENQTRINWISPRNTVTPEANFDVEFQYYLNTSTHDPNIFNNILINITPINDTQKPNQKYTITNLQTNTLTTQTINFPAMDSTGYHLGLINFWNGVNENINCSWWEFWCNEENIILGPGDSSRFNVATTTIQISNPLERETIMNACGDGMFDGAICRALTWLFLPDNSTAERFLSITENLGRKIPFAFLKLLDDKIETLEVTGTTWNEYELDLNTGNQYSLGTIKVFNWAEAKEKIGTDNLNTIAEWIKNIIWICFAIYVLMRINNITNKI